MKQPLPRQENRTALLEALDKVVRCAKASRGQRILRKPLRYVTLWRSRIGRSRSVQTHLFTGVPFQLALPAAADIFLCGGKTHDSELRLARFLIHYLPEQAHVLDVGAHYGYFTLLMAHLVREGRVFAVEAAPASFVYLKHNTEGVSAIRCFAMGLSDTRGTIPFYTFPAEYSEYNTLDIAPYAGQSWFEKNPPHEEAIGVDTLDGFCAAHTPSVSWIKMDVEGAEERILNGANRQLQQGAVWVMEYLAQGNTASYEAAERLFLSAGYTAFAITENGHLERVSGILAWMKQEGRESENMVFLREELPRN